MVGRAGPPVMAYVGKDGQPSGAELDTDAFTVTSDSKDVYTAQRGNRTWNVTFVFPADAGLPPSDTCVLCASGYLGPGSTVVLVNKSPANGGDLQTKVTVLADQVTTYDTDWNYIGTLDGKLVFDHLDQDSLDIGTVDM